jgi:hypothetical protein
MRPDLDHRKRRERSFFAADEYLSAEEGEEKELEEGVHGCAGGWRIDADGWTEDDDEAYKSVSDTESTTSSVASVEFFDCEDSAESKQRMDCVAWRRESKHSIEDDLTRRQEGRVTICGRGTIGTQSTRKTSAMDEYLDYWSEMNE